MDTIPFLAPIENPKGLLLKIIYYFTKKRFGKVITSVKIQSGRLPLAFLSWYGKMYQLDKKLSLPRETVLLVRQQVSRINVCEFCMDAGRFKLIQEKYNQDKFDALSTYDRSSLFSKAEKSMLDYVTELTKTKHVSRYTFDKLSKWYSERQICEIVHLVASEHASNIGNIALNIHSDMLCDLSKKNNNT